MLKVKGEINLFLDLSHKKYGKNEKCTGNSRGSKEKFMGNNVNSAGKNPAARNGRHDRLPRDRARSDARARRRGLLRELPELSGVCGVEVLDLMQRDSTDITADDRMQMARAVWENRGAYDGFVIAHGTDTLACTAALLHHLLPHIDRPVVVTGSMLPMGAEGSDAPGNLLDALRVAADGRCGVYAVLRGSILRGTNVLKVHSTALDAFVSANEPPAGRVADGSVIWDAPAPAEGTPRLVQRLEPHVFVLRLTPDLPPSFFSVLHGFPSVIIETFGGGGIPAHMEQAVRALIADGTRVFPLRHSVSRAASICINMRSAAGRKPWARCRSACGRSRTRSPRSCVENCKKQGGGR